jgi:hypothetical protein
MDHEGLLLWVHTRAVVTLGALEILNKHSGVAVHVHALPVTV